MLSNARQKCLENHRNWKNAVTPAQWHKANTFKKLLGSYSVTTKFLIGRMFFIVFSVMKCVAVKVASLRPFLFWELRSILRNRTAWQQPARTLHEPQNGRWHVMCQQGLRWLRATAGSIPRGLPLAATPHAWGFLWANGQLDRAPPTPRNSSSIGNAPNLGTEGLDSPVTRDGLFFLGCCSAISLANKN